MRLHRPVHATTLPVGKLGIEDYLSARTYWPVIGGFAAPPCALQPELPPRVLPNRAPKAEIQARVHLQWVLNRRSLRARKPVVKLQGAPPALDAPRSAVAPPQSRNKEFLPAR